MDNYVIHTRVVETRLEITVYKNEEMVKKRTCKIYRMHDVINKAKRVIHIDQPEKAPYTIETRFSTDEIFEK